jgi:hypothetical protein
MNTYAMPVTCRCGCGSTIARTRTFVNKDHQVAWLRAEAAKRRRTRAHADPELPPEPVAEAAPAPVGAPVAGVSLSVPATEAEITPENSAESESLSLKGEIYVVGSLVTALPVFLGGWLFCLVAFGVPLGGGLGWLPALVGAALAGVIWPLIVLAGVVLAVLLV